MEKYLAQLKAYREIAKIRGEILSGIIQRAKNTTEYSGEHPEQLLNELNNIGKRDKWEYCGIIGTANLKVLETLEYIVDDLRE